MAMIYNRSCFLDKQLMKMQVGGGGWGGQESRAGKGGSGPAGAVSGVGGKALQGWAAPGPAGCPAAAWPAAALYGHRCGAAQADALPWSTLLLR